MKIATKNVEKLTEIFAILILALEKIDADARKEYLFISTDDVLNTSGDALYAAYRKIREMNNTDLKEE